MLSSDSGTTHVVGAGLAGLAAAVRLSGSRRKVTVHEAAVYPGGRCRSYHDQATGMLIDNGTHLMLSGNKNVLSLAKTVGSASGLQGPSGAEFPFVDLATDERWTLRINDGRIPWWVLDKNRRVPRTEVSDYLSLARLLWASADRPVGDVINCTGPLYERLVGPLLLAALNIEPRQGSARLAGAVIRETLALGGRACRPMLAGNGIGNVFIAPAVAYLKDRGIPVALHDELLAIYFSGERVSRLDFTSGVVALGDDDRVILAVSAYAAARLVPHLRTPTLFRGIVNAHFRIDPPAHMPPMLGVINGTCEWIFTLPGRISVTISDAERMFETPKAQLAQDIWRDVAKLAALPDTLPPWQIARERRATFAATPEQNALRPPAETQWRNLFLAGDWTATGLPATLEGAIRSGYRAADLISQSMQAAG